MSTEECLHYEEETWNCTSGFIGFKKNQVFDVNLHNFPLYPIPEDCESSVFSFDISSFEDGVFVAVGHGESSMEALSWTVKHAVTCSTVIYLVHVFPVIKLIPSPMGMGQLPRCRVSPEYVDLYLTRKKGKKKLLLRRFIDLCVASEVKVEIILIEDDNVAKAIVELVADLDITKLVIGITKSNLSGSTRQNAIATQVLKNAQEGCDIKIICDGKEVIHDQIIRWASIRSSDSISCRYSHGEEDKVGGLVPFMRFMVI